MFIVPIKEVKQTEGLLIQGRDMSEYVEKANISQYRFFSYMISWEQEVKDLSRDVIARYILGNTDRT